MTKYYAWRLKTLSTPKTARMSARYTLFALTDISFDYKYNRYRIIFRRAKVFSVIGSSPITTIKILIKAAIFKGLHSNTNI